MGKYVDGYVLPVSQDNLQEYKEMANLAGSIWKEYGALEYIECTGDDLDQKEFTSFKKMVKAKENETIVFAWIVFESKEHRDQVNKAVMVDQRLADMMNPDAIFDSKRMVYGGFKVIASY
ncbi:hypothetical protein W03_01190 [Nitrosomonas sp. PY1]|uniref:DUF1428 domain-containing protein n=1 Tax=Nitrosomonas sp. PY1 TaxID=1803906 RepID=UPI001FC84455|nr:DUF1428 domain-containing protein [Nitrosomonas sp. PY1]GKS68115.1 hypothetical protein W03_01190 [Nitrosomonas sp. PY1]